ncbi:MAG TPA: O-antigen ligase family protein [Candidatus Acidoferrum sp.]|nr:O-antigen ligase family protein [Candidatus Acidoferrum sp.]
MKSSQTSLSPDQLLFNFFLALLFWAPLPFASNRPWGLALLFLGAAVLLACWVTLWLQGKLPSANTRMRQLVFPVSLLVLVQFGVFCQTVPLPRALVAAISPHAANLQLLPDRITFSLDPELTRFQLLQGLTYCIGFVLAGILVNGRERLRKFLWVLVISGAFQAVYGVLMTLSGLEYGFFVEKYSGQGLPTGTFVNRNNLAGYLVITLSAGIGLLISQLGGGDNPRTRLAWLRELVELLLGAKFRLRLMLALMVIALVLTRSRMGNLSFFLSLTITGAICLLSSGRQVTGRVALLLASLILVDMLIVGRWFGVEQVAERLVQPSASQDSRVEVSGDSLGIIRDFPWVGAGGGTFYTVFPNYSSAALSGDYYTHAHNDYLEMAGDLGLPLFGILAIFVAGTVTQAFRLQLKTESRLDRGRGFAVLMAVIWAAIHSLADFNLYIPANAFTLVALMALGWLQRDEEIGKRGEIPKS